MAENRCWRNESFASGRRLNLACSSLFETISTIIEEEKKQQIKTAAGPQPRPPGPVRQAASFPSQTNTSPFPPEVWAQLDGIDLVEEFKSRVVTFVNIPHTIRREYIRVQGIALRRHHPSLSQFVAAHDDSARSRSAVWPSGHHRYKLPSSRTCGVWICCLDACDAARYDE